MTTEEIKTIIEVIMEQKYKSLSSLEVSEKHKELLDAGEKQIENGEFYTNEEAKKISNEWLKE